MFRVFRTMASLALKKNDFSHEIGGQANSTENNKPVKAGWEEKDTERLIEILGRNEIRVVYLSVVVARRLRAIS